PCQGLHIPSMVSGADRVPTGALEKINSPPWLSGTPSNSHSGLLIIEARAAAAARERRRRGAGEAAARERRRADAPW
ncbi:MAG: hypothetical protein QOE59_955, partial [Actinomycetota bacterium]|nr:hypothetical protein [Actinomycetota bacterium]